MTVTEQWATRVTHLQISASHVLPVVFKSRLVQQKKPPIDNDDEIIGHGGNETRQRHVVGVAPPPQVTVPQAMPLLKSWLVSHMPQVHAMHQANLKPGSLQTPDVLRSGSLRLTVWLQPTSASYVVGHNNNNIGEGDDEHREGNSRSNGKEDEETGAVDLKFSLFKPSAQTLFVTAEKDE